MPLPLLLPPMGYSLAGYVCSVAFSPDGKLLAAGSGYADKGAKLPTAS